MAKAWLTGSSWAVGLACLPRHAAAAPVSCLPTRVHGSAVSGPVCMSFLMPLACGGLRSLPAADMVALCTCAQVCQLHTRSTPVHLLRH